MPQESTTEKRTASELLIATLEDFGQSEPDSILVIYTNADNHCIVKSNARRLESIGMLETVKSILLAQMAAESRGY